ncbi:hypothetical protein Y1Q_0003473 [Alligator mississippiensis]|uniref:Uncharacterized protein n=1 Tax=Alligator mississippiensis TaxID=8496 RepID=A0A151M481_ALLMI|nr:hypothetical protein Y1Q_0003473 [Alligator mississippiensis]
MVILGVHHDGCLGRCQGRALEPHSLGIEERSCFTVLKSDALLAVWDFQIFLSEQPVKVGQILRPNLEKAAVYTQLKSTGALLRVCPLHKLVRHMQPSFDNDSSHDFDLLQHPSMYFPAVNCPVVHLDNPLEVLGEI